MEHQHNQQNKIAFVLGNGTSRKHLKLNNLQKFATIYACNAIYREYNPNYLIAVDVKMINEIVASGYHKTHQVWTNPNKSIADKTDLQFFSPHKGWSSGPTALWFASQNKHKEIYIFGFDYQGINGKFNNVYADTNNYKHSSEPATYFGNWLNQTVNVINTHNQITYYRVIETENYIPDVLSRLPNLHHIEYSKISLNFPGII